MKRILSLLAAAAALPALAQEHKLEVKHAPRLDVVFAIDTTGSMGDEIEVVKAKLRSMVSEIARGTPRPDVRFGVVAYRDRGDVYVTQATRLTRDIDEVVGVLSRLTADGGGDEPEDVQAALVESIDRMNWDMAHGVSRMLFVVGDAGPHNYPGEPSMGELAERAEEKAIRVNAIGCSGLNAWAEGQFRTLAMATGGGFDALTYKEVVATADGHAKTVLTRAGRTYVAEGALDDREWKKGADKLAASGAAAPVAAAPPAEYAALGGPGGRRAMAKASAAPAPVTSGENNLDAVITAKVKAEAEKAGVKY